MVLVAIKEKTMNLIDNYFCKSLNVWNWRDCIELIIILTCCYLISKWLERDRTRTLLMYVYCYGIAVILSYVLNIPTINSILLFSAPGVLVAAIVLHQESLQKNFITPYKVMPATTTSDWFDELMQSCLVAINLNRPFICVIQHNDDLQSLLTTDCSVNAPLLKTLVVTLINSTLFQEHSIIWTTTNGYLVGINCTWIHALDSTMQPEKSSVWDTACTVSLKTDALFFKINPEKNSFDLAMRGNVLSNLTSNNCLKIIRQYLATSHEGLHICSPYLQKEKHEEHHT